MLFMRIGAMRSYAGRVSVWRNTLSELSSQRSLTDGTPRALSSWISALPGLYLPVTSRVTISSSVEAG